MGVLSCGGPVTPKFSAPPSGETMPMGCNDNGMAWPPKLKYLLTFDQNVEYKRPAGAYPMRDFHQIFSLYNVSGCVSF